MVTISCALRYSVRGRSTGTLISDRAPVWSTPTTLSVNRGSSGFGTISGAVGLSIKVERPKGVHSGTAGDISTIEACLAIFRSLAETPIDAIGFAGFPGRARQQATPVE